MMTGSCGIAGSIDTDFSGGYGDTEGKGIMIKKWVKTPRGGFFEWRCCGLLWELIPSRKYPDRYHWNPVCPKCGKTAR